MLKIHLLKALHGDSFLFEHTESSSSFLIDCGLRKTYVNEIRKKTRKVDFLLLTHVDEDHIGGSIPLINDIPDGFQTEKVYINTPSSHWLRGQGGEISIKQAISLENLIQEKGIDFSSAISNDSILVNDELDIQVISPREKELKYFIEKYKDQNINQKDPTPISINSDYKSLEELAGSKDIYKSIKSDYINASSIALIIGYKDYKLLFLGDSHPIVIAQQLRNLGYSESNKAQFDYIKLSHHGSATSISNELIGLISCNNYIISTNGGKGKSRHPSRETIAKIALNSDRAGNQIINFYFNYPISKIESKNGILVTKEEADKYNINLIHTNEIQIA